MKLMLLHEKTVAVQSRMYVTDAEATRVQELYEQARAEPYGNSTNSIRVEGIGCVVSFAASDISSLHLDDVDGSNLRSSQLLAEAAEREATADRKAFKVLGSDASPPRPPPKTSGLPRS